MPSDEPRINRASIKDSEPLNPVWESEARSAPKIQARAALLECAAQAFTTRGYSATTLAHVAELMGASKGQIYHYYRSKSDLYYDVVVGANHLIEQETEKAEKAGIQTPPAKLYRIAYAHTMVILEKYAFMRVALEATQHQLLSHLSHRQIRANARIKHYRDEYEGKIELIIQQGVDQGDFKVPSVQIATKSVLGSLNWLTVWFDPNKETTEAEMSKIAQQTAEFVVYGLSPDGPPTLDLSSDI
ncbi:hypothetical protein A9Q96_13805 [Rhodobacterales bacterium 52_120_T64]|nr:hypothetical protein A9Q96_13805 [Rhodobacterales bacterium 52_120_T64]